MLRRFAAGSLVACVVTAIASAGSIVIDYLAAQDAVRMSAEEWFAVYGFNPLKREELKCYEEQRQRTGLKAMGAAAGR